MKGFLTFLSVFLLFTIYYLLSAVGTHAQAIAFPIVELGNCNNVATCKVYCDQLQNHDACVSFAKEKGIAVGKRRVNEKYAVVLSSAKTALGCSTVAACQSFCEEQANWERCQAFAQKHSLGTSQIPSPKDEELLVKAKQNLNCSSAEECRVLCDKQENYTKCAALLQDQVTSDDRAMFEKYKPLIKEYLGCDSIVTCMAFCINPLNSKKCQEFGERIEAEQGGTPNIESPNPEVWCPKVSSECRWDGTNCVCQGPQTCAQSNDISGCTWDGAQCNCPGTEGSPEEWCPKAGPGCAWDGKECFCSGSDSPTQTDFIQPTQEPGEVWCPKIGPYCVWDGANCTCWDECVKNGGTWTGQACEYQGGTNRTMPEPNSETPEASCVRNPDCKWTSETCQCSSVLEPQVEQTPAPVVQGAKTNRGLLQQILDFILRR